MHPCPWLLLAETQPANQGKLNLSSMAQLKLLLSSGLSGLWEPLQIVLPSALLQHRWPPKPFSIWERSFLCCWRYLLNADLISSEEWEISCAKNLWLLLFLSHLPTPPHPYTPDVSTGSQVLIPKDQLTGIHPKLPQAIILAVPSIMLSNAYSVFHIPVGFAKSMAESQALHVQQAGRSSHLIIQLPQMLGHIRRNDLR